jgi:hypothetical protein
MLLLVRFRSFSVLGVLALSLAATATSASASAATRCPTWKATVSDADAANVVVYNSANPTGGPLSGTTLPSRGSFFEITGSSVEVDFGSVKFTIAAGSYFTLQCTGQTKGGRLWPTMQLASGRIDVSDPAGVPGAVWTYEGLFGPVSGDNGALAFSVRRTPANQLDIGSVITRF